MDFYVPGTLSESAYHLLTVIDFLCLAGGTYLLLMLHDRTRRSGHLLIAGGLAVLTLQIIPEHLMGTAASLRFAGATLSLGVACVLIAVGTLALVEDRPRCTPTGAHRALLVAAATVAVLGTVFVWALPFWEPLRNLLTNASNDSAFVTFQHGLRVGVASAFLACAWISWERRVLGEDVSRMFGAAYVCWAIFLLIGVAAAVGPEQGFWLGRATKVLGSLFIGNALAVYVYHAERKASERHRRLSLIDRVTSAAIAARGLQAMIEATAAEFCALPGARVVATYMVDRERLDLLRLAHATDDCADLPAELPVEHHDAIARALTNREAEKLAIECREQMLSGVAVPLMGVSRAIGVIVVGMERGKDPGPSDVESLQRAGAQLGVIMQHTLLLEETSQARDRWRQTFDSITELLTVHDEEGRIVAANRAALQFSGMSEREAMERTLSEVFGPECGAQEETLEDCISTGKSSTVETHRIRGRMYQVQMTPLASDERGVVGCVRVARDMTSHWRAEERRAQSERRYRELAEGANDIIYTHDIEGRFLYVNPAAVRVLGYSQGELANLTFWDIVAPSSISKARDYIEHLLDGKPQPGQIELQMTCADGRVAMVQLRANMLQRAGEGDVVHGIARDVTAEKQLTTQLIQADRLASVGALIAGVAHELNNPLTTISGHAEVLAGQLRDGEKLKAVTTIAEEAARCRDVAQNLLNFARQSESRLTEFDFNALTRGVCDLRAYDLRSADIELITDLQEDLPPMVGEYGQIQQLIYNLVENACRALQVSGGGRLEISTWAAEDYAYLRVADSGPGISETVIDRIFEPFVTTKPRGEGTGLGLSICRRIVEAHGGEIEGHNRPGGGACFVTMLPASGAIPAGAKEDEPVEDSSERPIQPDGPLRMLVIDDEEALCALVQEYLHKHGHDVAVAHTGEEGLARATEEHFDAIICDMRLPGISGEDVCMTLLEHDPEMADRIVVATGDILSPQTQSFFDRTGLPHIQKPFKLDQLQTTIARLVEGRPVRDG
ncbi:MAG: PAS domain S-box protein [Armatimonadota bacterium]